MLIEKLICDICGSNNVQLLENKKLSKISSMRWNWFYKCVKCGSSVGCHYNTFIPLGKLADKKLRELRKEAHLAFDGLWKSGLMSRDAAYLWAAQTLGIERFNSHISDLSENQLKVLISASSIYSAGKEDIAERRSLKRKKKRVRQNERDRTKRTVRSKCKLRNPRNTE